MGGYPRSNSFSTNAKEIGRHLGHLRAQHPEIPSGSVSTVGTADQQTQAAWQVSDIRAEVAELRARGVKVEDYDTPGLKTEDGIADIGFAWAAWNIDPATNALGILQIKK